MPGRYIWALDHSTAGQFSDALSASPFTSLTVTTSSLGKEETVTLFNTIVTSILDTVAPLQLKQPKVKAVKLVPLNKSVGKLRGN